MTEAHLKRGTVLLLGALGLSLVHCEPASDDDDDDAGESGSGAEGNASGAGGSTAGKGGTGSGGTTGGTSSGIGGSTAGAGSSGGGTSGGGGSAPTAGTSSGAGTGGIANASCESTTLVTTRGPEPQAVDEATFKAQWPARICAAMKPGCDTSGIVYDEAKCLAYAATTATPLDDTLRYDAVEAGYCLEELGLSTFSLTGSLRYAGKPAACYRVYRGELPPGAECDEDVACAPDPRGSVWCSLLTSVCTVRIRGKLGDRCHVACELQSDGGTCYLGDLDEPGVEVTCNQEDGLNCGFDQVCVPAHPLGCSCFYGSNYCNADAMCNGGGADAVCVPRGQPGAPCSSNAQCVTSAYCPREDDVPVCTPRKHQGEACDDYNECLGASCQADACIADSGFYRGNFEEAYCAGEET